MLHFPNQVLDAKPLSIVVNRNEFCKIVNSKINQVSSEF